MKRNTFIILILILLGAGALNIYAWKSPSAIPPAGGVQPPITSSINEQLKTGSIGINGVFAVFGNTLLTGGVKIADGTQKEFYALVSDSVGNASWQPLPARPMITITKTFSLKCAPGSQEVRDRGLPYCGYTLTTGSNPVYCHGTDERVSVSDTGVGHNRGIKVLAPNGCIAWEGPKNYGYQSCTLWCKTSGLQ